MFLFIKILFQFIYVKITLHLDKFSVGREVWRTARTRKYILSYSRTIYHNLLHLLAYMYCSISSRTLYLIVSNTALIHLIVSSLCQSLKHPGCPSAVLYLWYRAGTSRVVHLAPSQCTVYWYGIFALFFLSPNQFHISSGI